MTMLEVNQFYWGGGTDQFYLGEVGSAIKLALGEKKKWVEQGENFRNSGGEEITQTREERDEHALCVQKMMWREKMIYSVAGKRG